MNGSKKVMRALHILGWAFTQKNTKKMSKMMQNVIAVMSKRIMLKEKKMIVAFSRINLLKKKKTVTDIKFLTEVEIKEDVLAWNCLSVNKYAKNAKDVDE